MELTEKTLSTERLYEGKIINLRRDRVELPGGRTSAREVVEHPGGVAVLALDDRRRVALVRQYRYPFGEVLTEIPAGKLDHGGEDTLACGRRELQEETGLTAGQWRSLGEIYSSPGFANERIALYLATGLHEGEARPDEGEFLEAEWRPLDELVDAALAGELVDAKTVAAVLKVKLLGERGEI
ncbi:NUDIX domain-containing protein [Feifania hominis]|uniref:NUDIX hydrolase n=1 Tax=Feifania hominis TaxID=2763660 RepID=A0A926HUQ2_9FIRM|nr:NUDIX hydrolase [Feifania hominis]MBC8536538.1 NUDIX hydrolase [Feifania hominis]